MTRPDTTSGASDTPWLVPPPKPAYPPLDEDLEVDVAIIGGGISGLSAAYFLAHDGKRVAVLEDGLIASGETSRTTAHLASALDDRFHRLVKLHGKNGARLAYESHAAAIDQMGFIVRKHQIDCGYQRLPGHLFVPPGDSLDVLDQELEACRAVGFVGVEKLPSVLFDSYDLGPSLRFPQQGQFHPLQYLRGLAAAVVKKGGRIFERSHVDDYEIGRKIKIAVGERGAVTASAMVVATNAPIVSMVGIPLRLYAYRTYAIAMPIRKGSVATALYWDTAEPYHYVRLQPVDDATDLLIVGGEDHKTGQPGEDLGHDRYRHLEAWTRDRIPQAGDVKWTWSGQVMEPADSLAFIGRYPKVGDNVYVITGDSGHGMTHGTIGGMIIRDLVAGRENPWADLYEPSRVTMRSLGEVAVENLNTLPQYGKWLTPGDAASPRQIAAGEGAVIRHGFSKVAVYRDDQGRLHTMSAVCPHLGCLVNWNGTEKTWDCPCHGSRFSAEGKVLNGPANTDLQPVRKPSKRTLPKTGGRRRSSKK
jgi:glycine/D-amino acid oxidase-like deaminating enzyme/nitrite reductase/ring-hydroxylating ferredoxin subunit